MWRCGVGGEARVSVFSGGGGGGGGGILPTGTLCLYPGLGPAVRINGL